MEKNKELTPMMELIEFLKENQDGMLEPKEFLFKAFELLPKEKQHAESCCIDMVNLSITKMENKDFRKGMEQEFETYYNTKYNNQIK